MRDSFIFYKSFHEAISELPSEYRLEIYEVICQYSLYGEIPEMSGITKAMFILMKSNIDAAEKKYISAVENGRKGGKTKKENETKRNLSESNPSLSETVATPYLNDNDNVNDNVNDNEDVNVITAESSDEFPFETKNDEETTAICLPLLDGTEFPISQKDVEGWKQAYPAINILQELHKMKSWLEANPKNKKSAQGIKRFVINWLSRSQDRAKKLPNEPPASEIGFDLEEFFKAACIN